LLEKLLQLSYNLEHSKVHSMQGKLYFLIGSGYMEKEPLSRNVWHGGVYVLISFACYICSLVFCISQASVPVPCTLGCTRNSDLNCHNKG